MHKPETKLIFEFSSLIEQLSFPWRRITGLLRFLCDVSVGSNYSTEEIVGASEPASDSGES